jgi:hypothetical protein
MVPAGCQTCGSRRHLNANELSLNLGRALLLRLGFKDMRLSTATLPPDSELTGITLVPRGGVFAEIGHQSFDVASDRPAS